MSPDPHQPPPPHSGDAPRGGLRRRAFLAGAGTLGVALGASAAVGLDPLQGDRAAADADVDAYAFWGDHQAGIGTPAQDHLHLMAFDIVAERRADVADLMRSWTSAAALLCAAQPVSPIDDNLQSPPGDTGETIGSSASHLTVTFGFGPGLFESQGVDRFGLAGQRPKALAQLPTFPTDQLDAARSDGDLVIQACADDPVVAFHAVHNLARMGRGVVVPRWSSIGFGRTSSTTRAQETPRNLMGMKDGTDNIRSDDAAAMTQHVWVGSEGPGWMRNGSYMVARRIRILLEEWDRSSLDEQQQTIGRHKVSGAPLGGIHETDAVDLDALDQAGHPLVATTAHIRLAAPSVNGGERILRRGYSFDEGIDPLGEQDAGLMFICFQRDPTKQFVAIQRRLSESDALNKYIRHTSSAVFACPSGAPSGDWIGRSLLAT